MKERDFCISGQLTDAMKAVALSHGTLPTHNQSLLITNLCGIICCGVIRQSTKYRGLLYTKDYATSQKPCRFDKDEMSLFYFLVKSDYKHFNDDLLLFFLSALLLGLLSDHGSRLENSKGLQMNKISKGTSILLA